MRTGALAGGTSIPLPSSRAFAVGVQMSTSAGDMPPGPRRAEALPGPTRGGAKRAKMSASPANLKLWRKPILLRRPTGLAVGLARKELAPPPDRWARPENVVPPLPLRPWRSGFGVVPVIERGQCSASPGGVLMKRKYLVENAAPIEVLFDAAAGSLRLGMNLSGRKALLTGATGGLGRAIAKALAQSGAQLTLSARKPEALEQLAA